MSPPILEALSLELVDALESKVIDLEDEVRRLKRENLRLREQATDRELLIQDLRRNSEQHQPRRYHSHRGCNCTRKRHVAIAWRAIASRWPRATQAQAQTVAVALLVLTLVLELLSLQLLTTVPGQMVALEQWTRHARAGAGRAKSVRR